MAWETGTATSHEDLYTKLLAFLTTNRELVDAQQNWTRVWQREGRDEAGVVLAGPGLAGLESVYVGMVLTGTTPSERSSGQYWITTYGMTGVIETATSLRQHVNPTPRRSRMYLDAGAMTYWFIANGRRFIVIVKISTVFESMYAGLFLPYATPIQYPYPFFLGGSVGDAELSPDNWRNLEDVHRGFPFSISSRALSSNLAFQGATWTLTPGAEWLFTGGAMGGIWPDTFLHPNARPQTYFQYALQGHSIGSNASGVALPTDVYNAVGLTGDDQHLLTPLQIVRESPSEAIYGVLDGCYTVSGHLNAAENLINIDGVDHLVVQNTFRTSLSSYFAVGLE